MAKRILLTGSSGFLGRALVESLSQMPEMTMVAVTRKSAHGFPTNVANYPIGDIRSEVNWQHALQDVDTVIHAAARVHVMDDQATDPLQLFRELNTEATLRLARQAAEAGVKRFIFISTIKVNGEQTAADKSFKPDDSPAPADPYAVSKYEAEQGLFALAETCTMEVVVIRPVLVYGPGVKANFLSLMGALRRGLPLPLGRIRNARSLVSLGNLVDFIKVCVGHPNAANQIFLVSDGLDLSTTELSRRLIRHLRSHSWLIPVPTFLIDWGARLLGRGAAARRLVGSLRVDISKNRRLLDWTPPMSVDDGLRQTVEYFLKAKKNE